MAAKKDDSIDKLRNLIREVVSEEGERKERESKDPFERIRGIIREEIGSISAKPEPKEKPDAPDKGKGILEILTGTGD